MPTKVKKAGKKGGKQVCVAVDARTGKKVAGPGPCKNIGIYAWKRDSAHAAKKKGKVAKKK